MLLTLIEGILAAALPFLEKALLSWLGQALHIAAVDFVPPTPVLPTVVLDPTAPDKQRKLALLQKVRDGLYIWQIPKHRAVDAVMAKIKLS